MPFLVIILYALFGFSFTLGKIILSYATPFFAVASRMIAAGITLLGYIYWRHRISCYPLRRDFWAYVQITLFGIFLFHCPRAWALQYLTATKQALIFNLSPFFTALFSYIHTRQQLTMRKFIGLLIGFASILPIAWSSGITELSVGALSFFSLPELVTIGSVASLSYSMTVMQQLVKDRGCPPYLANGICMLLGGILAFNVSWGFEGPRLLGDWRMLVLLVGMQMTVSNLICSNLQAFLLRQYSATFLAFAGLLSPLFAAFYGWILFGESIRFSFILSVIIVFIGLLVYYFDEVKELEAEAQA